MEQFIICKERADWIAGEIAREISRRLQAGEKILDIVIKNDDPGMDYVMVDFTGSSDNIMIDAQEEWRRREYNSETMEG